VLSWTGGARSGEEFAAPERFLEAARRRTGLDDFGDPHFRDGLEALCAALAEQSGLTLLGVVTFRNVIIQSLVNRVRFVGASGARQTLDPPIIITGLPRSGTTILHRLLALDPKHHAPQLWELLDPYSATPALVRRWRARAQVAVKTRLLRDLDRKHYTRADTHEECTLLLANSLTTSVFWDMAPLDGYLEWYQSANQEPVYRDYRRQLEVLQAIHPDRRLVLKAPGHLGNLAELHAAVPEARIIQTHRDPTACFFSHCSLRETLSRFVIDRPDRSEIGRQVERVFRHDLRRNLEFFDGGARGVVHVPQAALRTDPVEVVRGLYERFDLEWGAETGTRIAGYLRRFPRGRFGAHRPTDDGWGVTRDRIDGLFGDYRERFDWAFES
jgi:hypothetical protein